MRLRNILLLAGIAMLACGSPIFLIENLAKAQEKPDKENPAQEKSDKEKPDQEKPDQEKKPADEKPKETPKNGEQKPGGLIDRILGRARGDQNLREYAEVAATFRPVVARARQSTAAIFRGKDQVALGAIVSADGYILSKASEVRSGKIECALPGGKRLAAKLIGVDKENDLALLKVEAEKLSPVEWSEGEPAIGALLATPGPGEDPLAIGVASTQPRTINAPSGILGIRLDESELGPKIVQVMPGSGAEKAGLKVDDVVTRVNGKVIAKRDELIDFIRTFKPGDKVELAVKRGDSSLNATAILQSQNENPANRRNQQNALGGPLSERRAGFSRVVQHDSVLRPNECGGPLVDLEGKAIGLNIARGGRVESYAIPAKLVLARFADLKAGKFPPGPSAEEIRAELARKIDSLKKSQEELASKMANLEQNLKTATSAEEETRKALEAATAAHKKAQDEASAARTAINSLKGDLDRAASALRSVEQEREQVE